MGFMDFTVVGSDTAADLFIDVQDVIAKRLSQSIDDEENEFNTDGLENVSMILFEFVLPYIEKVDIYPSDKLLKFLARVSKRLKTRIKSGQCGQFKSQYSKFVRKFDEIVESY